MIYVFKIQIIYLKRKISSLVVLFKSCNIPVKSSINNVKRFDYVGIERVTFSLYLLGLVDKR